VGGGRSGVLALPRGLSRDLAGIAQVATGDRGGGTVSVSGLHDSTPLSIYERVLRLVHVHSIDAVYALMLGWMLWTVPLDIVLLGIGTGIYVVLIARVVARLILRHGRSV